MSQVTRTPASTPARTTSGNLIPTSTVPRGGTSSDTKTSGYTSTVTSTIRNGNGGSSFGSGSSCKWSLTLFIIVLRTKKLMIA